MSKGTVMLVAGIVIVLMLVSFVGYLLFYGGTAEGTLILATTTSTQDSGLLDYIIPEFEAKYNCNVSVIASGSGAAMRLGEDGDCDVLLVHSPSAEVEFVNNGHGDHRTQVMYNNFVIVGPTDDPVDVSAALNATEAFQKIHDNGTTGNAKFISRADDSGTYNKELSLWARLGYDQTEVVEFDSSWYIQARTGMGAVLDMCEEKDAYTLSDDATYYSRVSEDRIPHLNMTFSGDPQLFNQYSVIAVNDTMWPNVNRTLALKFIDWIVSEDGQDLIATYEKYGHQLFFPNAPGYVPDVGSLSTSTEHIEQFGYQSVCDRLQAFMRDLPGA